MDKRNKRRILPRLSRRGKVLRNLLLILVCLFALWAGRDYPLPTAEMEFRRAERENLVAQPTEIQGIFETQWDRWVVGVGQEEVLVYQLGGWRLRGWPIEGTGPTLIPVPEMRTMEDQLWVAAVGVPPGAESARLELTTSCWYTPGWTLSAVRDIPGGWSGEPRWWEKTYEAAGEPLEDGGFLFHMTLEDGGEAVEGIVFNYTDEWAVYQKKPASRGISCAMEAIFYDASGAELGRGSLHSPD